MQIGDTLGTRPSLLWRLRDSDDHSSWQHFLAHYWRLISSFTRRYGLPGHDAKNVIQEVVAGAIQKILRLESDRSRGTFHGRPRVSRARRTSGWASMSQTDSEQLAGKELAS